VESVKIANDGESLSVDVVYTRLEDGVRRQDQFSGPLFGNA
jgi:hypothetical protein